MRNVLLQMMTCGNRQGAIAKNNQRRRRSILVFELVGSKKINVLQKSRTEEILLIFLARFLKDGMYPD